MSLWLCCIQMQLCPLHLCLLALRRVQQQLEAALGLRSSERLGQSLPCFVLAGSL